MLLNQEATASAEGAAESPRAEQHVDSAANTLPSSRLEAALQLGAQLRPSTRAHPGPGMGPGRARPGSILGRPAGKAAQDPAGPEPGAG